MHATYEWRQRSGMRRMESAFDLSLGLNEMYVGACPESLKRLLTEVLGSRRRQCMCLTNHSWVRAKNLRQLFTLDLVRAREHLSALRSGSVVREEIQATVPGRGVPGTVRRRLRGQFPISGGRDEGVADQSPGRLRYDELTRPRARLEPGCEIGRLTRHRTFLADRASNEVPDNDEPRGYADPIEISVGPRARYRWASAVARRLAPRTPLGPCVRRDHRQPPPG